MARATKYNKLTSPELLARVNPENLQLMEEFLAYLRSMRHSKGTINGYRNDLRILFVYVMQNCQNKHFTKLTKRELIGFQNWLLNDNENSPARIRRIKSAISSLGNYVEDILDDEYEGYRSPIKKIKSPSIRAVRAKTVWEDQELEDLLQALTDTRQYEKACVLALAIYSGRRKSELLRFKVHYFDEENVVYGSLYRTPEPIQTKGTGGGKMLTCYTLRNKFKPYLDAWLAEREELGIESEWLFPNLRDPSQPLPVSTLDSWARQFSVMTNKPCYFHSFRHKFVTELSRSGLPDGVITKIVGWDDPSMCQVYNDREIDEELGQYFDENGIKAQPSADLSTL